MKIPFGLINKERVMAIDVALAGDRRSCEGQIVLDDRLRCREVLVPVDDGPFGVTKNIISDLTIGGFLPAQTNGSPPHRGNSIVDDADIRRLDNVRTPASAHCWGIRADDVSFEAPVSHAAEVWRTFYHAHLMEVEACIGFEDQILRYLPIYSERLQTIDVSNPNLGRRAPMVIVVPLDAALAEKS